VLTSLSAGLASEVTGLREENARLVRECRRLIVAHDQLAQDHAQLRDQSIKTTKELKAKNLELNSKC
jgi:FtsZ-binding cell division protein ZapB